MISKYCQHPVQNKWIHEIHWPITTMITWGLQTKFVEWFRKQLQQFQTLYYSFSWLIHTQTLILTIVYFIHKAVLFSRRCQYKSYSGCHNATRQLLPTHKSRDTYPSLLWRHNGCGSVSNHQPHDCLLNCLFRRRSKKTSKLRVTGLCAGNSPGTGEFPALMASNAKSASIWWRHHDSDCKEALL